MQDAWNKEWNNSKLDVIQKRLENIKKTSDINLPKNMEDVTKIYLSNATPNKGKIIYDDNYDIDPHKDEIDFANFILKNMVDKSVTRTRRCKNKRK